MTSSSARFTSIYDSLPRDVQESIVEKQLIPLLDLVGAAKRKRILSSASKMQRRHTGIPSLNIKAKQREVNSLLDEIHRDAKRSFVRERSQRTELLEQTVESVTGWLNDIWRIVYEHNVDFMLAHRCLLFTVTTLDQIGHTRASCRCAFTSMYVPITLKRKSGKVVKSWHLDGADRIEEVLQFIWRDLFLSMLATGSQRQIQMIPDMLDDIEDLLGWTALERLLYGGRKCPHDVDDAGDSDSVSSEDEDAYTDEDSDLDASFESGEWLPITVRTPSPSHARHWSHRISSQMDQFRRLVQAAMTSVFKIHPSQTLYSALLTTATDPNTTAKELLSYLERMSTTCSEIFTAAIDIYALENDTAKLVRLLNTHSHLIRQRDFGIYQRAVQTLAADPHLHSRALEIVERELLDTASAVRSALLGPFSQLETDANRAEIEEILKLRPAAPDRHDRVDSWLDSITTPGTNTPNPIALAAMVMGIPIAPLDVGEESDPLGYLDLDPTDPDLQDLRDESRPNMKQRFAGWADIVPPIRNGAPVLNKVYKEIIKKMPYLRSSDVVEELQTRLAERPGKQYLMDAVDELATFVKRERRKAAVIKNEQKRRANAATPTPTPLPAAGPSSFTFNAPFPPSTANTTAPGPFNAHERPETPPPPLEPVTHEPATVAPPPAPLFTFYTGEINGPPSPGFPGTWSMEDVD